MSNEYTEYDLECRFDNRKSFYGKAHVKEYSDRKELVSYSTHVATIFYDKDKDPEIYNMQSATTLRHIKEFFQQIGFEPMSKSQLENWYK